MAYQYYSILGLIFDIIGVSMLFKTGLPPDIEIFDSYYQMPIKVEFKKKIAKRKKRFIIAIIFVMMGFVFQSVGTYLSI